MNPSIEILFSVALGIGLAAASGFRVFVPLLVAGLAARADWIPLTDSFAWLQSTPALIALGTAAVFETIAFYVPGLDHVLDVLAAPVAVVAGVLASASVMVDLPSAIRWPIAVIAGGGVAGLTKATTALVRAKTGVTTAGLGNPVVSTAETVGSAGISVFAIVAPVVCLAALIALFVWAARKARRMLSRRRAASTRTSS